MAESIKTASIEARVEEWLKESMSRVTTWLKHVQSDGFTVHEWVHVGGASIRVSDLTCVLENLAALQKTRDQRATELELDIVILKRELSEACATREKLRVENSDLLSEATLSREMREGRNSALAESSKMRQRLLKTEEAHVHTMAAFIGSINQLPPILAVSTMTAFTMLMNKSSAMAAEERFAIMFSEPQTLICYGKGFDSETIAQVYGDDRERRESFARILTNFLNAAMVKL